jgi:membrane associated rhomboid family serine protease
MTITAEAPGTWASIKSELRLAYRLLAGTLAVMWGEEIVDLFLDQSLNRLGIVPRTLNGLLHIPLAPFLHVGFGHLISNTIFLVILGWLVLLRETRHYVAVFAASTLLGGLGVWLFGREGNHLGASGVVYGLMGYLLLAGWFERKVGTVILSLGVGSMFSWMLYGMLPTGNGHISWEGHLFGFAAGVLMARILAKRPARAALRC